MEKSAVKWVLDIIKTVVISILISMVFVLVFALIVKVANVNENVIAYVNVGIKVLSIAIGCLLGFRRGSKSGWLKGLICGVLYIVCSFLVFSFISGKLSLENMTWLDVVTGAVAGILSGVLAVNAKKDLKIA